MLPVQNEESRRAGSGGFVLVSVLWILAILTVIALGFARRAMLERQMAWYALDREQAQLLARGAAERGLFELANKNLLDGFNNQIGYTAQTQRWAQPVNLLKESVYFEAMLGPAFAGEVCEYFIVDNESRISLNDVPRGVLERIEGLRGRTIDELLDRRRVQGRGYQSQRLRSVDELLDLQEIRPEVWYGDAGEAGLRDLLTVWGDRDGGRINVNTAPARVLMHIPGVKRRVVERIVEYRAGRDGVLYTRDDRVFTSVHTIGSRLKISAEKISPLARHCKTDSRFFTINAHASRRGGKINAYCTVVVELQGGVPSILEWRENTFGA